MTSRDLTKTKKFKSQKSAGKLMATAFWNAQGLLLLGFLLKGKTINSEAHIKTFKKLRARPQLEMKKVFLQHDNTRPTSIKTREAITSFG